MRTTAIVFLCVVAVTSAATWRRNKLPEKPKEFGDREGCYVEEINDVVPFGETVYPIGHCYRIQCGELGMDYASCGVIDTNDQNCYITDTDLTKPYPHCCPEIKCNGIE